MPGTIPTIDDSIPRGSAGYFATSDQCRPNADPPRVFQTLFSFAVAVDCKVSGFRVVDGRVLYELTRFHLPDLFTCAKALQTFFVELGGAA